MNNRRNFYRILHVQPEAPLEVIKASYRSLMTKLKLHPDLGGDHESAVLINQAYAVLSDPQRRRQYDEILNARKNQGRSHFTGEFHTHSTGWTRTRNPSGYPNTGDDDQPPSSTTTYRCLFCRGRLISQSNKHCIHCGSPLSLGQHIPNDRLGELIGRRTTPRITKAGTIIIYPSWPHPGYPARLRDLSTSGISLLTAYGARVGQILKFDSNNLKAVARVVSVRANGSTFSVHASFLTAEFANKSGLFVTEKA
jgi:curved DNA-binding protein CbpA